MSGVEVCDVNSQRINKNVLKKVQAQIISVPQLQETSEVLGSTKTL